MKAMLVAEESSALKTVTHWIGGRTVPSCSGRSGPIWDPATGEVQGRVAFASAEEANAFAQHYPGAFVVAGDVPGRGLTYRVRYGNFPTYKDATSAKDNFEKQHNVIALVAVR